LYDRIEETIKWLDEKIEAQRDKALYEDPVFKFSEVENRLKRLETTFNKVSSIPKPKPKLDNIKIDNITIDGNNAGDW